VRARVEKSFQGDGRSYGGRSCTHLGSLSQKTLQSYLAEVKNFVDVARNDPAQPKVLKLEIESHALKKQLAKELYDLYHEQQILVTEYNKQRTEGANTFTVKLQHKRAQFAQNNQESKA
jgi:hypothetical protein